MRQPVDSVVSLLRRCAFAEAGVPVVCAVSGGADSSALAMLAVAAECAVTIVHVDHGLRPDSRGESAVVEDLARSLGVSFRSVQVDVGEGANLEARARSARRAALAAVAEAIPAGIVATGHTADDRAETVLINVLRGAGPWGLAPMAPSPRQPILALRRSETVALCAEAGIEPLRDPMNVDRRFLRVRVRHELLPLLADMSNRDPVPILCRQADHLGTIVELLGVLAADVDPTDARALRAAPEAVGATAVRQWLRATDGDQHPPDTATIARVLAVAQGASRATDVGGGRTVRRHQQRLYLD